jgi:TusA-related sulfurtransferase
MSEQEISDLRGVPCPTNAARALLALEMTSASQMIFFLDDGEAVTNVKESLLVADYPLLAATQEADKSWKLTVQVARA